MANIVFDSFTNDVLSGTINLTNSASIFCALCNTVPNDASATEWNATFQNAFEVTASNCHGSDYEFNEGLAILNATVGSTTDGVFNADDVSWTLTNADMTGVKAAVLYYDTGSSKPLIVSFDFGSPRSAASGGSFVVEWSDAGIFELSYT